MSENLVYRIQADEETSRYDDEDAEHGPQEHHSHRTDEDLTDRHLWCLILGANEIHLFYVR